MEGIGMGLSICKKIIERANGKIDCFSRGLNQGSTFMFSIKMPLPYSQVNNLTVIHEAPEIEQSFNTSRLVGGNNEKSLLVNTRTTEDRSKNDSAPIKQQ